MTARSKMSVQNRAKQFMPFSALPGLDEALARMETVMELNGATEYTPIASEDDFSDCSDIYSYISAEDETEE